jgi:type I restriction enzyme M protein
VCDPCCGSAGFLITAMREVRKQIDKLLGLSAHQRRDLLSEVFVQGFEGADSSPNMVLMGRINMALHGDPKARVFRVGNSLTTDIFTPESFDVILTNPPFKKGGITDKDHGGLLESFRSDISNGAPSMNGSGLALGAKPDSKGVWKPVNSIDPAILFIDRCLQGKFIGGKAVVRAVVSLPAVTFRLSGAGAKTSFLYLQKTRPGDEQGPVFMAVANNVGFDVKANKEVLTGENDLIKIVEAYRRHASCGHRAARSDP